MLWYSKWVDALTAICYDRPPGGGCSMGLDELLDDGGVSGTE